MDERETEVIKKINPYMLEDPMYNYILRKKEREKKERIDQLKTLLDESSSSSSDDEVERGKVKKKKKKKHKEKVKKKKKNYKKEKKSKKKRKRKSSSSPSSSSSSSSSSDSSDDKDKHSKRRTSAGSPHKKKHKAKRKKKHNSYSSDSDSSSKQKPKRKSSSSKGKENNIKRGNIRAMDTNDTHRGHSSERHDRQYKPERRRSRSSDRLRDSFESRRYERYSYRRERRSSERRHRSESAQERRGASHETAGSFNEVDRLIAIERARLKDERQKDVQDVDRLITSEREKLKENRTNEIKNKSASKTTWDAYIDNMIHQSEDENGKYHISRACIIALDGGVRWTSDNHAKAIIPTMEECLFLAECFEKKNFKALKDGGFNVEGIHYNFLDGESNQFKTALGSKEGYGAITLHASKTAIIVAYSTSEQIQGNACKGTRIIAEYLESMDL